jgi:hypothetical protein
MAGFSCYNVTPLPKSLCSTLFVCIYKRPLKEGWELFVFCLGLFGLGFLGALALFFCFGLFSVRSFWKGKELLKGKEFIKGNC